MPPEPMKPFVDDTEIPTIEEIIEEAFCEARLFEEENNDD